MKLLNKVKEMSAVRKYHEPHYTTIYHSSKKRRFLPQNHPFLPMLVNIIKENCDGTTISCSRNQQQAQ